MNRELRELSGELLHSQDEERRRLARELHDGVGQNLAALQLMLSAHQLHGEPSAELDTACELIDSTAKEIRTMSYLLHPPLLDELGLVSALKIYAEGFSARTGIAMECLLPGAFGRLEPHTELALFRIVQEALGNIHRHSESPSARIELRRLEGAIELAVSDQGKGIRADALKPGRGGVGLASMRQRAAQLGGNLEIRTGIEGTTIVARLPVAEA